MNPEGPQPGEAGTKGSALGRTHSCVAPQWCWLGQAGFLLAGPGQRVVIDPYLSDSLAAKYRGRHFEHQRMMPPPIAAADLDRLDWVLASHGHSDHLDPGTLPILAQVNPACRFVVPAAVGDLAVSRGVPADRLVPIEAGQGLELTSGLRLQALASAHEELTTDAQGRCCHLGFVLRWSQITIYHSGDCIPYPGLAEALATAGIDLALLPVNGRDEERRRHGVAGNFTIEEAIRLCQSAGIPALVPHHWGMFAFNSPDPAKLRQAVSQAGERPRCLLPEPGRWYPASGDSAPR